jgi:tetratricopeptide (TPR) repeat protein
MMHDAKCRVGMHGAFGLLLPALLVVGCTMTPEECLQAARRASSPAERVRLLTDALDQKPDMTQARMARAWVYVRQDELAKALADCDVLREQAERPGEVATVEYLRGRILNFADKPDRAVRAYTAAVRANPNFIDPYGARGWAYFQLGEYYNAMKDFQVMLDRDISRTGDAAVRRSGWQLRRGFAGFCAGEWRAAAQDFHDSIRAAPSPARKALALLNLYFVQCRVGDRDRADQILRKYALETLKAADPRRGPAATPWIYIAVWYSAGRMTEQQFLRAAKHSDPETEARRTAEAHYYIGARALIDGDRDRALAAFTAAAAQEDPESFEYHMAKVEKERLLSGGKSAGDWINEARRAQKQEEKIRLYTEALRVNPNSTDARLNRALIYSLSGEYDRAIDDYTRLLKVYQRPQNIAMALRYRGWTYAQTGNHTAAVKDYRAAIEADPELWLARQGLAESLAAMRRYKDAARIYLELTGRVVADKRRKAYWRREAAFALACAGDHKGAVEQFRAVIEQGADGPIVRTNLFIAQCRLGDRSRGETALKAYADKIKIAKWEASVAWYAAGVQSAASFLKASRHSDPAMQAARTSRAYYYIGAIQQIKGNKPEAREAFQACAKLAGELKRESWEVRLARLELANEAERR